MASQQPEITIHKRLASIPIVEHLLERSQEGIQAARQRSLEVARERSAQLPAPIQGQIELVKTRISELQVLKERIPELRERAVELLPKSVPELKERAVQVQERLTVEYNQRSSVYLEKFEKVRFNLLSFLAGLDAFCHQKVDVLEEKYPFWLQAPAQEIFGYLQERRVEITRTATVTFDEKVKLPAIGFGKELDERAKPIIDLVESKFPTKVDQSGAKFQYERALKLGEAAKGQAVIYSTEQLKQLREKNPALDRSAKTVTDTAASVSQLSGQVRERLPAAPTLENIREVPLIVRAQWEEKIKPLALEKFEQYKPLAQEKAQPYVEKLQPYYEQALTEAQPFIEVYQAEAPLGAKVDRVRELVVSRSEPVVNLARNQLVSWLDIARAKVAV